MADLPELPFELVLSYLSLEDVIKSRRVSRTWKMRIDNYKVKSLCFSSYPSGFIEGKSRWVSGAFAQNFISAHRYVLLFFGTFSQTILSNLKYLRLFEMKTRPGYAYSECVLSRLQSFSQLQELEIIRSDLPGPYSSYKRLKLSMLRRIHIDCSTQIGWLTLETPRLQELRIDYNCRIKLVHGASVERVTMYELDQKMVKHLKNLKQLYFESCHQIDPKLLSGLEKLRKVHTNSLDNAIEIFEQKRRYGRAGLKVYLSGLLLNGPEDTAIHSLTDRHNEWFVHLAENQSKLADEIPYSLHFRFYSTIERVAPEVAINVLKRLPDLSIIMVDKPVHDVTRFLNFLKTLSNINRLHFESDQPQDLFDRLPEHCALQILHITKPPPDFRFLFRLKHLLYLQVAAKFDAESIRRILELEFVSSFHFHFADKFVTINIEEKFHVSTISSMSRPSSAVLPDVNAAIEFVVKNARSSDSGWKTISRKLFST